MCAGTSPRRTQRGASSPAHGPRLPCMVRGAERQGRSLAGHSSRAAPYLSFSQRDLSQNTGRVLRATQQLSSLLGENPPSPVRFPPLCLCGEVHVWQERSSLSHRGNVLVLAAFSDFVFVSGISDKKPSHDSAGLGSPGPVLTPSSSVLEPEILK